MTINISDVYIEQFEANLRHLAQRGDDNLMNWCQVVNTNSNKYHWPRLGSATVAAKSSARTATPTQDPLWSERVSTAVTYHGGMTTEPEDLVQMLVDPNSAQAYALAMAMKRNITDVIIAATYGNSEDEDGSPVAYTPIDRGTAVLNAELVTEIGQMFLDNNIDPAEPKVLVIGPTQWRQLMNDPKLTSSDYMQARALVNGELPTWLGFSWIVTSAVPTAAVAGAGDAYCIAMTKRAMGVQLNKDIWVRIAEDPSLSFATRIYTAMTFGVTRIEDEHVYVVDVDNTYA